MQVSEIFFSIQGESTYVGMPCAFIRLAGCNLECGWCDTDYAKSVEDAKDMSIDEILKEVKGLKTTLVEVTGGEPMGQAGTVELTSRLLDEGYEVLMETNGSVDLSSVDERVVKVIDIKCPMSGHDGSFLMENLGVINESDEVKFVIGDEADYEYAKRFMEDNIQDRTLNILFAPVRPDLDPAKLADWILKDALRVRLQLQIHSYIWKEGAR